MLTVTIDWLAGTFKEWTNETENFLRTYADFGNTQAGKPRNGYNQCEVASSGVELFWSTNHQGMGYHAVFSGTALRNLFELSGVKPLTLLHAAIDAGMRVSRLDLAKDCTGETFDGEAIYKSLEQGLGGGASRTVSRIVSNNNGETIYLGSRQSERFIRIYNKAAQTGNDTELWWRLEIETKGDVARLVASSLLETGSIGRVLDGTFLKMVGTPNKCGLTGFVSTGEVPFGLPKITKQTDREKWISEQVIGAVAQHFIEHPDSVAVRTLIATLDLIDKDNRK